jgi:ubiquinone/menaquinone biosynthesis C-methylase UbiE
MASTSPVAANHAHAEHHITGGAHHQHLHELPEGLSYAQANAEYFNKEVHQYEDLPGTRELMERISNAIRDAYAFNEDSTTVLDFACGIGMKLVNSAYLSYSTWLGMLSRKLAPHVKSIVGVDISQGSVEEYNLRVANQGIPPEEMRAVVAELKGLPGELNDAKFDIAVVSASLRFI